MRKSCMIEEDKKFEAKEVAMTNDIESEVAMDESTADSRVETLSIRCRVATRVRGERGGTTGVLDRRASEKRGE